MPLPTDDLLSAFHDGESAPAERAAVEQRLAISVDARRELSEIKQISAMLKELPCDRLPFEFPQQVLQVIEREMLIPSRQGNSMDSERTNSSRRWFGAIAVLTSAAGLLLLVQALNDRAGRNEPKLGNVAGSPVAFSATDETAIESPLAMTQLESVAQSSNGSLGAAGPNSLTGNSPTDGARVAGGFGGGNLYFDQAALGIADVGDVVRAIQRTEGDEVAVVFLTVVDRKKGLEGLQLLLTKNQIAPSGNEALAKANRSSAPAGRTAEMEAVLVRSSAAQLESALKQLRDENYLQSLEVDQPILLAELGEVRGGRAELSDKAIADDAKQENAKSSPELASSARRAKTDAQDSAELKKQIAATAPAPAAAKPSEKRDAKELFANQTRYGVSAEMLQQNQLSQQTRARSLAKGAVRSPSPAEKDANRSADQRPLQVLFVVVDQTQAGKPQTLPGSLSRPASAPAKTRSEPAKPSGQDGAA